MIQRHEPGTGEVRVSCQDLPDPVPLDTGGGNRSLHNKIGRLCSSYVRSSTVRKFVRFGAEVSQARKMFGTRV